MKDFADNPAAYIPTIIEMLIETGGSDAAALLESADQRVYEVESHDWNINSTWVLSLGVTTKEFARLGSDGRQEYRKQILERMQDVLRQFSDDNFGVEIVPKLITQRRPIVASGEVSRATRQNIIDGLRLEGIHWAGELDDVDFLGRLFELKTLPSTDKRYPDAAADIWQHRINNDDGSVRPYC